MEISYLGVQIIFLQFLCHIAQGEKQKILARKSTMEDCVYAMKVFWTKFFQVFIFNMNDQKRMERMSKFPKRLYICIMLLQKSLLY